MAAGKPVIAYGKGGALETIIPLNPLQESTIGIVSDKELTLEIGFNQKSGNLSEGVPQTGKSSFWPTGVFFYEQSVRGIIEAIQLFTQHKADFDPDRIRKYVEPFDRFHFKERMQQIILSRYEERCRVPPC